MNFSSAAPSLRWWGGSGLVPWPACDSRTASRCCAWLSGDSGSEEGSGVSRQLMRVHKDLSGRKHACLVEVLVAHGQRRLPVHPAVVVHGVERQRHACVVCVCEREKKVKVMLKVLGRGRGVHTHDVDAPLMRMSSWGVAPSKRFACRLMTPLFGVFDVFGVCVNVRMAGSDAERSRQAVKQAPTYLPVVAALLLGLVQRVGVDALEEPVAGRCDWDGWYVCMCEPAHHGRDGRVKAYALEDGALPFDGQG